MSFRAGALAPAEVIEKYEPVIGLEVHVQLVDANQNLLRVPDRFRRAAEYQRLSGMPGTARRPAGAQQACGRTGDTGGAGAELPH